MHGDVDGGSHIGNLHDFFKHHKLQHNCLSQPFVTAVYRKLWIEIEDEAVEGLVIARHGGHGGVWEYNDAVV